ESSSRRSTAAFFSGSKPEYPRRMHCIQGSDAHHLDRNPQDKSSPWGVGDRVTEVALPEISFQALKEVFLGDDFASTRPYRPAAETPFDHIKAARQQGRNIVQSFHETFSPKPSRMGTIIYDIVAFANTNGGTIYLGVGASPRGPVRGIDKPDEVMALLHDEIHKSVTPPMEVAMDVKTSDGRKVIEIKVPQGKETPYVLGTGQIYVRQESETSLAMRDEIIRLVERRSAPAPSTMAPPSAAPKAVEAPMTVEPVALLDVAPPRTGVEVLEAEERENVTYYTVQDLRNGNVVRNVTRFSARHLWHYAITEREARPIREEDVAWQGNIGLWKTYQRAGVKRYNLVQRDREGKLHVYYGVTEEGIHGEWRVFLEGEKAQPQ
ncbi:MAG: ATP-binding protein, partial [Chloroflexi bacterium]|nr:ATP-binding protein [Chloroflexota bacterium]